MNCGEKQMYYMVKKLLIKLNKHRKNNFLNNIRNTKLICIKEFLYNILIKKLKRTFHLFIQLQKN